MNTRNLFLTAAFAMLSAMAFAQVEIPEVKPKADSLQMAIDTLLLEGVTITAERPLFSVEGEKTLYQVSDDPTVQGGTASDALQNAPGVSVDVEGNITLRGTSSVEIWINDQPANLTQENLKTYIQTLPANAIDRIEVITNPSARYATSADGIINIVMNAKIKRNEFLCLGTNVSLQPYVMPWASYVWKNEKWTMNAFASTYFYHGEMDSQFERDLYRKDENSNLVQASHITNTRHNEYRTYSPGLALNLTYTPDNKNTYSFYVNYWDSFGPSTVRQERERTEYIEQAGFYKYLITNTSNSNYLYLNSGLYYQHKFNEEGHNLTFRVNGDWNRSVMFLEDHTNYTLPVMCENVFTMDYLYSNAPISAKVDYNLPYSKNGEFSMGFNGSLETERASVLVDTLVYDVYERDSVMSYRYLNKNQNLGGYFMVRHRFGDFTVQPGISLKYYRTSIAYPDAPSYDFVKDNVDVLPFDVLPSMHLSYRTKSMHNFKLSYSMKIKHPTAVQLSPFNQYDIEMYTTGNPYLEPIYTQNLEASWTKYWDDFGSVGLTGYYKGKKNDVNTSYESGYHEHFGRTVFFTKPVNVGYSYTAGGEFNMMYRPSGMLNIRFYANLYDSYLESDYGVSEMKPSELWSYSLQLSAWAKLWNRLEVHASGRYTSPVQTLFQEVGANYSIDCGMRTDFFDHKLSVFVNGYDLFGLKRYNNTYTNPVMQGTSTMRTNSTYLCVGFTMRFGNVELENEAQTAGEQGGQ